MPAAGSRKRAAEPDAYEEDDFVENDDGRATKKSKKVKASNTARGKSEAQKDDDGSEYWELSRNRRVVVSEFKGKLMVNIREYYEKDGKSLPGKKGIGLPLDQFTAFLNILPAIDTTLRTKGEKLPRPKYDDAKNGEDADDQDEEGDDEDAEDDKKNFEATSDEED